MSYEELAALPVAPEPEPEEPPAPNNADVSLVLENGIREISGEVRNSLDFHRSQEGGGDVSHVVLSGAAQDIPGFVEALHNSLGVEVRTAEVSVGENLGNGVSRHRLAVATGLAALEAPQ
jgi:type IV pilus assembly protein PilM